MYFLPTLCNVLLRQTMLVAIFARIFREFSQIFRNFAQVFRDFARMFDRSKRLGVCLHPLHSASYTTGLLWAKHRT